MNEDGFTEADWLAAADVDGMLSILAGGTIFDLLPFRLSQRFFSAKDANRRKQLSRKLRLFSCACCHQLHPLLDNVSRNAIQIAEQYADGFLDSHQLSLARNLALTSQVRYATEPQTADTGADARWHAIEAVIVACSEGELVAGRAMVASQHAASAMSYEVDRVYRGAAWEVAWEAARKTHAAFVLHSFGNPFRACPTIAALPTPVVNLAGGLYNGEDCAFALHDALLEAGHLDLAEHFRKPDHPKGCWALDVILGKS
jgi:hypothetical protein